MSQGSAIEWTDATLNALTGCSLVSPGCTNCYAMRMSARLEAMGQEKYTGLTHKVNGKSVWTGKVKFDPAPLLACISRKKPTMYFVNSMSDLFHADVKEEWIDQHFAAFALAPQHTFQILTKRPERMAEYLCDYRSAMGFKTDENILALMDRWDEDGVWGRMGKGFRAHFRWPLPNVWLGTSVENQKAADERIPHLLKCPAAVRFLSCEPLLGPINFQQRAGVPAWWQGNLNPISKIDWAIVGGESGPCARPCSVEWIRSIVGQCKAAGVACFVKQLGSDPVANTCQCGLNADGHWKGPAPCFACAGRMTLRDSKGGDITEFPADLKVREFPKGAK